MIDLKRPHVLQGRSGNVCSSGFLPPCTCLQRMVLVLVFLGAAHSFLFSQETNTCNVPFTGGKVVVDDIATGLASILSGSDTLGNLVDGDLSNYVEISGLDNINLVGASLVRIKDIAHDFPAGQRTGFVIEGTGGLLLADVLNSLTVVTYLDNEVQESATFSDGTGGIALQLLSTNNASTRRIDFETTLPFDEVELQLSGVISTSLLSALRVYYAYQEPDGCDYDCARALNVTNYPGSTSTVDFTGVAVGSISGEENMADADTTNAATASVTIGIGTVQTNVYVGGQSGGGGTTDIPGGVDVGFVFNRTGLLGLLDATALGNITIQTLRDGAVQESYAGNNSLVGATVLSTGEQSLSFTTVDTFDQVRLIIGGIAVGPTYEIYYAFIRFDADQDGFPDCVDRCPGQNDGLDADGDGIPDGCDTLCTLKPIATLRACSSAGTAQLPEAGPGQTWAPVPGNPSPATIDQSGSVTGLTESGNYQFELTDTVQYCSVVATVEVQDEGAYSECNIPLVGPDVVIGNQPGCTLCAEADVDSLIDADLSASLSTSGLLDLSLLDSEAKLVSVVDTAKTFEAGTRAGFVIKFDGLLQANVLAGLRIQTYLDGLLQEISGVNGAETIGLNVLAGPGAQRLSFSTALPYDEIELVLDGSLVGLSLLTSLELFYAFTEPAEPCSSIFNGVSPTANCGGALICGSSYQPDISYERTGLPQTLCADCSLDSLSHLVDSSLTNYTTISLLAGALGDASVSLKIPRAVSGSHEVGYAFRIDGGLLDLDVLSAIAITTFLEGVQQDQITANSGLASVRLLDTTSNISSLSFFTTADFDEVQFTVDATVAASVAGGTVRLYYGFINRDADGDQVIDCLDRCCAGDDQLDDDGDGIPNACDDAPVAVADTFAVDAGSMDQVLAVVANDTFGGNGPDTMAIRVVAQPANGMATVDENNTPANPTDDTLIYTPDDSYAGADTLAYQICDLDGDCDTAIVVLDVMLGGLRLNATVLLQGGLLNSGNPGIMRDDLREQGVLPLTEPYSGLDGFSHAGAGGGATITDSLAILGDLGDSSVVDWVFLELRSAADSAQVMHTRSALVLRNGQIIDVDGGETVFFAEATQGDYFISMKHRNHLGVMTKRPVSLSHPIDTVDFTDTGLDFYERNAGFDGLEQATVNGRFALHMGDAAGGFDVIFAGQTNDTDLVFDRVNQAPGNVFQSPSFQLTGYLTTDVDLDGRAVFAGQHNDTDLIFNVINQFALNVFDSVSFVLTGQLPE